MDVLTENPTDRATIWRARLETRAFGFEAFGATRDAAVAALVDGLRIHSAQYELPPDWWRGFTGANTYAGVIVLGQCYRDGDPLRDRAQPMGV